MAVPEVNPKLLEQLTAMGFTPAQATRALHFSGNSIVDAAIDWILDHLSDPDFNEMPRVSVDLDIESPEPTFVTEETRITAQELRDQAEEEEKKKNKYSQRESEKERRRAGKELLEAKAIAEENERKRYLAAKKAEKDEEQRARKRILQKLQTDKLERRGKLGLPSHVPATSKPSLSLEDNRKNSTSYISVTKMIHMRECLRSLMHKHKGDDARVRRTFQTLLTYVGNVVKNPEREKFRWIRLSNPVFQVTHSESTENSNLES